MLALPSSEPERAAAAPPPLCADTGWSPRGRSLADSARCVFVPVKIQIYSVRSFLFFQPACHTNNPEVKLMVNCHITVPFWGCWKASCGSLCNSTSRHPPRLERAPWSHGQNCDQFAGQGNTLRTQRPVSQKNTVFLFDFITFLNFKLFCLNLVTLFPYFLKSSPFFFILFCANFSNVGSIKASSSSVVSYFGWKTVTACFFKRSLLVHYNVL